MTAPRRHPDAAARVYEEEAFIVLPHKGQYKILNKVGTRVWDLLDGNRSTDDIARMISDEYETSYEVALNDVEKFISDLSEHGMLAELSGKEG